MINLFLDDRRAAPPGWTRTWTAEETIAHLVSGAVDQLSLDYNLGPDVGRTGAAVLTWMDQRIATDPDWKPPRLIRIHSTHGVGRPLMIRMLQDICQRLKDQGREPPATIW